MTYDLVRRRGRQNVLGTANKSRNWVRNVMAKPNVVIKAGNENFIAECARDHRAIATRSCNGSGAIEVLVRGAHHDRRPDAAKLRHHNGEHRRLRSVPAVTPSLTPLPFLGRGTISPVHPDASEAQRKDLDSSDATALRTERHHVRTIAARSTRCEFFSVEILQLALRAHFRMTNPVRDEGPGLGRLAALCDALETFQPALMPLQQHRAQIP